MPLNDARRVKNRIMHQSYSTFSSRQHARFYQLTRMDTAFARFESARLPVFSLGYLARTCLWRMAWTVWEPERCSECYQRQMACCRRSDSQKNYIAVEKAFSSSGKAEWRTYSAHFLLISWLKYWNILFSYYCDDNINDEPPACKLCFMTCKTILFVSQVIRKFFRWEFQHKFEDTCSLHTGYMLFCSFMQMFGTFFLRHPVFNRLSVLCLYVLTYKIYSSVIKFLNQYQP